MTFAENIPDDIKSIIENTVRMKDWEYISKGSFGRYYIHKENRNLGMKTLGIMSRAHDEFDLLCKAAPSEMTPLPYGIKMINNGIVECYAIFMEHIEGDLLEIFFKKEGIEYWHEDAKVFFEIARQTLLDRCGISHGDIHEANVIITEYEKDNCTLDAIIDYKIIDFTPSLAYTE